MCMGERLNWFTYRIMTGVATGGDTYWTELLMVCFRMLSLRWIIQHGNLGRRMINYYKMRK
jgi:hypothetical protein